MTLPYGYAGKILNFDLTKAKFTVSQTVDYAKDFLGGLGINAKILWDQTSPRIDPFSPENCIVFGTGPLTGTMAPGAGRMNISSKSPLTNGYACTNMGGAFPGEMKFAGYDHIAIRGQAAKPSYLWIDDERVELKDASGIWGRDTIETQEMIQEELGDPEIKVISIGPAGENKVRFASVVSMGNTAATKGAGAVMGSKNLKAIAVRGTGSIELAKPDEFYEMCMDARKKLHENLPGENYQKLCVMIHGFEIPEWETFGNFEGVSLIPEYANIGRIRTEFAEKYWVKDIACFGCPSRCYSVFNVPGMGTMAEMCECWHHWGRSVKVPSMDENFKIVLLTQRAGMDYLSLANVTAFTMELYSKGIITSKDTDGLKMEFGNAEAAIEMAEKIVRRNGFGNTLAEGVKRAAAAIGRGAEKYANHVKGRELTGMDPRSAADIALAAAVEYKVNTGQNYFSMIDYFEKLGVKVDLKKLAMERVGTTAVCDPGYDEAPIAFKYFEDIGLMCDVVSICRMVSLWTLSSPTFHAITPEKMAAFISAAAFELDVKKLWWYTEKCRNLVRAYEVREGFTRKDDTLPEKMFKDAIPKGVHKGKVVDPKKFEEMLDNYYTLRGWDVKTGIPTRKKLEELGLKDIADYFEKAPVKTV